MPERVPAIKVLLLPKDTNALGTIFGGVILSNIDLASAVEARKTAPLRYVTKAMREVEFHAPVYLGDIVSFYTETLRVGRTSITVKVLVEVERWSGGSGEPIKVTEAEVVLVAVGPRRGADADSARAVMIAAFAPGSVSNVGCGFDVLGFALEAPGDVVIVEASDRPGVEVVAIAGDGGRLPRDPRRNTASVAIAALLDRLGAARGIRLSIEKGLPLASGMGSSGASAVAAVVAANELLGRPAPLERPSRVRDGGRDGRLRGRASRQRRAVALRRIRPRAHRRSARRCPAAGARGARRARSLHPHLEVETGAARAILGDAIPLRDGVRQWANMGALVAGLFRNDLALDRARARGSRRRAPPGASRARLCRREARRARGRRARLQPVGVGAVDVRPLRQPRAGRGQRRRDVRGVCARERRQDRPLDLGGRTGRRPAGVGVTAA